MFKKNYFNRQDGEQLFWLPDSSSYFLYDFSSKLFNILSYNSRMKYISSKHSNHNIIFCIFLYIERQSPEVVTSWQ